MNINTGIPIEIFLAILPLIIGLIMMVISLIALTKKFEDQYDGKTKEIAIVYDDKFEREINRYIEKKKSAEDYEIQQEELNDRRENIMIYASEYYNWMGKSTEIKGLLRNTAMYFLGGGILSPFACALYVYVNVDLAAILGIFVILLFAKAIMNFISYIRQEGYIDEKYSKYELRRIKDW
jgi:Ca2+/Na+ antiporter